MTLGCVVRRHLPKLCFAESKCFASFVEVVTQTSSRGEMEGGDVKMELKLEKRGLGGGHQGALPNRPSRLGSKSFGGGQADPQPGLCATSSVRSGFPVASRCLPPPPSSMSLKVPHTLCTYPQHRKRGPACDGIPRRKADLKNIPFTIATKI